jgi:L-asparaginase
MRTIQILTTGGTIEKTYDETTGALENRGSVLSRMLAELRLDGADLRVRPLLSKDSLHMTDGDREGVVSAVREALSSSEPCEGVVILHGTDTLTQTGEALMTGLGVPRAPVVLTGAMRPFEMKQSDALQNLTEAVFAAGVLAPGVYWVGHGKALAFPGVRKDRARGTFVK